MLYTIAWYIPQRVVFVLADGRFSVERVQVMQHTLQTYLDAKDPAHPVHIMLRIVTRGPRPIVVSVLERLVSLSDDPRVGCLLCVGGNSLTRYTVNALADVHAQCVRMFDDQDALLAYLRDIDESLDWRQAELLPPIYPD